MAETATTPAGRERGREECERSARELEAVFQSMVEAVIVIDEHDRVVRANRAMEDLLGMPLVGGRWPDLLERLDVCDIRGRRLGRHEIPSVRALGGERARMRMRVRNARGEDLTVDSSASPIMREGRPAGAVGVWRDVSEQERLLHELGTRNEQLRAILDSMMEGVIVSNARGDVLDMNAEALRIHGFDDVEQVRRGVRSLPEFEIHSLQDDSVIPVEDWPVSRASRGETFRGLRVKVRNVETGDVWFGEYGGASVRDEDGSVLLTVVTLRDITGQVRAEQERDRLTAELRTQSELTRHELETTRHLLEAAEALAEWVDFREVLEALTGVLLRAIGHTRVTVALWDTSTSMATVVASAGVSPFPTPVAFSAADMSVGVRQAIAEQRTIVVDYDALPEADRGTIVAGTSHTSLVVPLVRSGKLIGGLLIDDPGQRREFSAREIEIVEGVAAQAAVAMENARLSEERQRSARLSEALNEIDGAVSSTLEFEEIMARVVELAAGALDADLAVIFTPAGDRWDARYAWNAPPGLLGRRFDAEEIRYSEEAAHYGQVLAFSGLLDDPGMAGTLASSMGMDAVLDAPLMTAEDVVGDFAVFRSRERDAFDEADLDFMRKVASSVRLALQNARSYALERNVADTLQRALLAIPHHVDGIDYECLYRSAAEAASVGGDFYDVFALEDGRVGIVIGDVSGKGLAASTLTSLVRNTLRAYAYDVDSPAEVVAKTNRVIVDALPQEMFMTLAFGLLDPATGGLAYCNAGHPPGLLLREDGRIDALPATSPVIGAFKDIRFEEADARLGHGDVLLLYTDGIIEARGADGFFGEARLKEVASAANTGSPKGLPQRVFEAVRVFTGDHATDDIAMLAVALEREPSNRA